MSQTTEIDEVATKFAGWFESLSERERTILTALLTLATEDEVQGYRLDRFKDQGGNPATQRPSGLGAGGEFTLGGGPGGGFGDAASQIARAVNLVDRVNDAVSYLGGS